MKLPKGITGLWNPSDGPGLGNFSVTPLKNSLYPVEYSHAYKIGDFKEQGGYQSYYRLPVTDKRNNPLFEILAHTTYPYYCGVQTDTLIFIDLPKEITGIADPKFTYLTAAELNASYTQDDLAELLEVERKEIRYWRPRTVGEIIFNHYD